MGVYHFDDPQSEQDLYKEILARKTQWNRAKASVTKADADRATAIAKLYPNFSPDVITSLTMLQVKPEAEVLRTLSERILEHNKQSLVEKIFDPLKGAVRFGLLALEDLYRTTVDRPINSMIAATIGDQAEDLTFREAYSQSGKSTVKQVFSNLAQGKEINLGDGLLPNSEVFDPQNPNSKYYDEYKYLIQSGFDDQRAQSIIQNQIGSAITEIDRRMQEESGQFTITRQLGTGEDVKVPISLGRTLALGVAEPGTKGFNAVSGILDAGKALFLDPSNYLFLGLGAARKSAKTLRASDNLIAQLKGIDVKDVAKMTQAELAELGVVKRGWGLSFISPKSVTDYLNKDPGGMKLVKYLSNISSESKFMDITGITDPKVVQRFMNISQDFTKTADEKVLDMANLLDASIGFKDLPFGNVRPTVGAIGRFLGGATEAIAKGVPEGTGQLFGAKKVLRLSLMDSNSRMARVMSTYTKDLPLRYLDAENIEQSFDQIKKWLDQTTLNRNTKDNILREAMSVQDGDRAGLFRVATNMLEEVGKDLVDNFQVSQKDADMFTRIFEETYEDMRKYFIDGFTGENVMNPFMDIKPVTLEGKLKVTPSPAQTTEFINRTIPMPDAGGLAKAMNSMSILRNKLGGTEAFEAFLSKYPKSMQKGILAKNVDKYYTEFWKPFVLLRGAWLLRVVGEEQLRMYTRGYDNIFSRPLSLISLSLLKKADAKDVKRWTQKDVEFLDLFGNPLDESKEWIQGSSRMRGANNNDEAFGGASRAARRQEGRRKKPGPHDYDVLNVREAVDVFVNSGDKYTAYERNKKKLNKAVRSWVNEVSKVYQDDLFKLLFFKKTTPEARLKALKEWVKGESDEAKQVIAEYAKGGTRYEEVVDTAGGRYVVAKGLEARLQQVTGGAFDKDEKLFLDLLGKFDLDEIDFSKSPYPLRLDRTKNDELYNLLITGQMSSLSKVKGVMSKEATLDNLFEIFAGGFNKLKPDAPMMKVNELYRQLVSEYGQHFPDFLPVAKEGTLTDDAKWIDNFIENAFDVIMGQRTDNASRSPVFRQAYWRAVYDLLPRMTPAMRTALLEGKTFKQGGKTYKVQGARKANIPDENLLNSIKADIGLTPEKLRKRDVEINLDMFERRVKELNEADLKLGTKYVDNTKQQTIKYNELQKAKLSLQKQLDDLEDKLTKEIDDDPEYKKLYEEYQTKQDASADYEEKLVMEEYGGYYSAYYDDMEEGFETLSKYKANKMKKLNKEFEDVDKRFDDFKENYELDIKKKQDELTQGFEKTKQQYQLELEELNVAAGFTDDMIDATYIDDFAKSIALSELQDLLYDLSKRNKMTYNLRGIFPFGEAYVEILTTWAKLLKDHPEIARRGQVTVQALRDENPFSPVEGEGFLAEDEITGEEVFYYPIVNELVSDALFGADRNVGVRLPGYAGSLNLALEIVPGIGPVAAIPAAAILEGTPKFEETQKFLFPYGLPTVKTPGDLIQEAGVPAWLKNGIRAMFMFNEDAPPGELSRIAANTTIDVYRVLKANGEDDMTPQQQDALMKKARSIAKNITLIKAFSQFVGPTGLNPRFDIGNPNNAGAMYSMQILADRYRELIETPPRDPVTGNYLFAPGDNYSATKYFIDEFGFNPLDIATPKSIVVEPRPVDERGVQFEKENPEIFDEYPLTAFYAVPNGGGGAFDYEAYTRSIYNEQREPLTPEEWLATRNQRLGEFFMEEERIATLQQFDITDPYQAQQRSRLLAVKRNIAAQRFPGFDTTIPGLPQRGTLDQQFQELKQWKNNTKLNKSDTGKAVNQVLDYIQILEKKSLGRGLSADGWRTSRTMLLERQQLRDFIGKMAANNDDFYVIAQNLLLPLFQERTQFLEDLEYDYDTMLEYGAYLPIQQGEA